MHTDISKVSATERRRLLTALAISRASEHPTSIAVTTGQVAAELAKLGEDPSSLEGDFLIMSNKYGWLQPLEHALGGGSEVWMRQEGVDAASEVEEQITNRRTRKKALRNDLLAWLYEQQYDEEVPEPSPADFAETGPHYFGDPYTENEVDAAGGELLEKGLIMGDMASGYKSPQRAVLTETGRRMIEDDSPKEQPDRPEVGNLSTVTSTLFKRADLQYLSAALASGLTQDEINQYELGLPITSDGAKIKRAADIVRHIFEKESDPDSAFLKLLNYIYLETTGVHNARDLLEYKRLLIHVLNPRNVHLTDDGFAVLSESTNASSTNNQTATENQIKPRNPSTENEKTMPESTTPEAIFIVHGHDEASANKVRIKVHAWTGIMPTVLGEQAGGGRTIIEKFEKTAKNSNFALVMLTPDDEGRAKNAVSDVLLARARQNVILELGYFYGALGRDRVAVLYKDVELPSDINGVNYIGYESSDWTEQLRAELIEAGFSLKG